MMRLQQKQEVVTESRISSRHADVQPPELRIYDAIVNFRQSEKLEPTTSDEHLQTFLGRFNWDDSQLTIDDKSCRPIGQVS